MKKFEETWIFYIKLENFSQTTKTKKTWNLTRVRERIIYEEEDKNGNKVQEKSFDLFETYDCWDEYLKLKEIRPDKNGSFKMDYVLFAYLKFLQTNWFNPWL